RCGAVRDRRGGRPHQSHRRSGPDSRRQQGRACVRPRRPDLVSSQTARPPWMERPSRAQVTARLIVLVMIVVAVIYPFMSILSTSLASQQDVDEGGGMVVLPLHPSLNAYVSIFQGGLVTHSLMVSIGITLVGT